MDNRTLVCLLWIACVSTALAAREQTVPAIIAANAGENVRFSSGGSTAQIRVVILTPADQSIFDSGWKDGNVLDWSTASPAQSLADGSYRCTIMVKDLDGQLRQKDVALLVQGGRIAIDPASENADPKIALFVHDEKNGAIINTSGDLSFRFGKFFEGTDAERMRLTADGDLRVEGMIRTNNGIMFSDGTVLRMSNGEFVVEKPAAANPNGRRILRTVLPPQPTATPGRLKPIPTVSPDFQFKVDAAGVHIGTTPAFGLDVAGNVTLASNLLLPTTASPSVGVIMMGTSRFVHNFGTLNTFLGANAGNFTTTGSFNTAVGAGVLQKNTSGSDNTAIGLDALLNNTTGHDNAANGYSALGGNTTGVGNVAEGASALASNTTGNYNTASGLNALSQNTSGSNNVGIGVNAGSGLTTGDNNIDIGSDSAIPGEANTTRIGDTGTQTRAFMAGINGVTTAGQAVPVFVDANGQLGTVSSSRRYKFDVADMGASTADLMRLRPVTFRYLAHGEGAPLQYGLIAEEVAEVYPEMVTRNKDGEAEAVMYQFLAPMLLNQVQRQQRRIEQLEERLEELEKRLAP